jgi:hypothetical protein
MFHRLRSVFERFRARMAVLFSLKDFIDRFGANTDRTDKEIIPLEEAYAEAAQQYLQHRLSSSEEIINSALQGFTRAENTAREEKRGALFWVYTIEWLVSSSAFFVSGYVLWILTVRRRLYRAVSTTKLRTTGD